MATTLDLLNNVLTGLRKERIADGTTEVTSAYHLLLLQFLNIAKEEVENAWDWKALRVGPDVTVAAGTNAGIQITTSGGLSTITAYNNARLMYEDPMNVGLETSHYSTGMLPLVFDRTDASAAYRLKEATPERILQWQLTDQDQTGKPEYFALQQALVGTLTLRIYPIPADQRTIRLRMLIPDVEFSATDLDAVNHLPDAPVWLRALELAKAERGEEVGPQLQRNSNELLTPAGVALANAIAREQTAAEMTGYPI